MEFIVDTGMLHSQNNSGQNEIAELKKRMDRLEDLLTHKITELLNLHLSDDTTATSGASGASAEPVKQTA